MPHTTATARKAAHASWDKTGTDPAARRRRTIPGRVAMARKLIAEVEAAERTGGAA
jgi:hypothetical protein